MLDRTPVAMAAGLATALVAPRSPSPPAPPRTPHRRPARPAIGYAADAARRDRRRATQGRRGARRPPPAGGPGPRTAPARPRTRRAPDTRSRPSRDPSSTPARSRWRWTTSGRPPTRPARSPPARRLRRRGQAHPARRAGPTPSSVLRVPADGLFLDAGRGGQARHRGGPLGRPGRRHRGRRRPRRPDRVPAGQRGPHPGAAGQGQHDRRDRVGGVRAHPAGGRPGVAAGPQAQPRRAGRTCPPSRCSCTRRSHPSPTPIEPDSGFLAGLKSGWHAFVVVGEGAADDPGRAAAVRHRHRRAAVGAVLVVAPPARATATVGRTARRGPHPRPAAAGAPPVSPADE